MVVLVVLSAPLHRPVHPGGLDAPAAALAIGRDPGALIGPVLVNLAGVAAVFGIAWLVFRRQEL
jgi:hypothetical protein